MAELHIMPDFVQLSDSVYFRNVDASSSLVKEVDTAAPSLILLLSWGGAPLRNVAKYITGYTELFPYTPLLLVRTEFSHILRHTPTSQDLALEPVLSIISRYSEKWAMGGQPDSPKLQLLVHAFSNGGTYKLIEIAKRYRSLIGISMPISMLYLDSTPGMPTVGKSLKAISYALPKPWYLRLPGMVLVYIGLIILRTRDIILCKESLMNATRRHLNEPGLVNRLSKRCYIYSPEDDLIGWRDVQNHAQVARQMGFDVREEIFSGSQHVAHARQDPNRYWQIVQDQWAR